MLADGGWRVRLVKFGPARRRSVALPDQTAEMLSDIWGASITTLCQAHHLTSRRVSWSGDRSTVTEIGAFSVDIAELCASLECRLRNVDICEDLDVDPNGFVVEANGGKSHEECLVTAGTRNMVVWPDLPLDHRMCRQTETLSGPGYWMFVLPTGVGQVSLQVATPGTGIDRSRIEQGLRSASPNSLARALAPSFSGLAADECASFSIAPRLGKTPVDSARFTVGDRAVTFDPVSGDGTGQGIRSAILIVGALNALSDGGRRDRILGHVASRYRFAFGSHLKHCIRYYRSIVRPEHWVDEVASMRTAQAQLARVQADARDTVRMQFSRVGGPRLVDATPA